MCEILLLCILHIPTKTIMLLWRTTLEIKITTTKRKRKWKYWNIQSGFRMSFLRLFLLLFISLAFVVGLVAFLFPIPIHCAQTMGLVFIIALQGTNNAYRLQLFASHQSVSQSVRQTSEEGTWMGNDSGCIQSRNGFWCNVFIKSMHKYYMICMTAFWFRMTPG